MAKRIQLTNNEIDALTRILDDRACDCRATLDFYEGDPEEKIDFQRTLKACERIGIKLSRIYRQQNTPKT